MPMDSDEISARLLSTYQTALEESQGRSPAKTPAAAKPPPTPTSSARKRSDLYSKKMGELLLKGWKMLGENCPATGEVPLMQHPVSGRKFSIAAGKYTDEMVLDGGEADEEEDDEYALVAPPAAPSPPAAPAPAADDDDFDALAPLSKADEARRAADRKQSDEWCAAMSALMLKGWKMLGDNCPITGRVPLMQHPTNERKFSVAANKYLDEMPAAAIAAANPAEAGSAPPPPRPPPAPTTTALAVAPAPAPAPTPRAPPRAQYAAAAAGSATASLEAARAALVRKLDETVAALAEAPPPASALVDAVAKCADALAATERALKA